MNEYYPERYHGYQLSLYNFAGAVKKLSGLDKLIKNLLEKTNIGYYITPGETKPDYHITSTYDCPNLLEELKTLDNMQLGYIHHQISNNLRKKEIQNEFEYLDSLLTTNARLYNLKKEAYKNMVKEDFRRPLIIEDFCNHTEHSLEKSYKDGMPIYEIVSKNKINPMKDRYIEKGKSRAINHYYDFSDLPQEEADRIWDIFNAKISKE